GSFGIGAGDQVTIVRLAGEARPDLLPVDDECVAVIDGARLQRREIGPGVGLAHAEAEDELAADDARKDLASLLLGPMRQERGADLPVAGPMCRRRCAGAQALLGHDRALDVAALAAAVRSRPRHPDPAGGAHAARELGREA